MRRTAGGLAAFLVLTGTFLVLPVYAAPLPEAKPVAPSIDSVDLGSVDQPEDEAVVTADGTVVDTGPAADVDPATPAPPPADEVEDDGGRRHLRRRARRRAGAHHLPAGHRALRQRGDHLGRRPGCLDGERAAAHQERPRAPGATGPPLQQDDMQHTSTTGAAPAGRRPRRHGPVLDRSTATGVEAIVQAADGATRTT